MYSRAATLVAGNERCYTQTLGLLYEHAVSVVSGCGIAEASSAAYIALPKDAKSTNNCQDIKTLETCMLWALSAQPSQGVLHPSGWCAARAPATNEHTTHNTPAGPMVGASGQGTMCTLHVIHVCTNQSDSPD